MGELIMATHVVAWNFKPEVKEEDKTALKKDMKQHLEGLVGIVPGLVSATFIEAPLAGSNREMALVTTHNNAEDIAVYAKDPNHNAVADKYVRPYTADRASVNW